MTHAKGPRRVLIGDSRFTRLYEQPVTQQDAQAVVDVTLESFGYEGRMVQVEFVQRKTLNRWGTFFHKDVSGAGIPKTIILYPKGQNTGTVLHELTHFFKSGHGPDFKHWHSKLLELWE